MKRSSLLAVLVAVGTASIGISGYQQQQTAVVRDIQKVADNLYFISGGDTYERPTWTGGNVAVLVADVGVVLVDTMVTGSGRGILERVRSVTTKPVTMIISTHTHSDHTGSNTEFPATIEYVAHENTKAHLTQASCPPVTNCAAFAGEKAKFLPKRTFTDHMTLLNGRDRIELHYFGRGHTDGDAWVVFPAARMMHTGDMFQRMNMPFIDAANNGGSALEFNATLQKALSSIKGVDMVIGGHTPAPVSWNDFREFTEFYQDFFTKARDAVSAGQSVEDFSKSYRLPDRFKGYRIDPERVRGNVQSIANELKKK